MTDSGVHRRLLDLLAKQQLEDGLSPSGRAAVEAFVLECRANGDPPERVLLKLKAVIAEARAGTSQPERRRRADAEQAFKERLIGLCIECYYRTEPEPPVS